MPEETVADQHTYRERVAAGARIREGSMQLCDLIAAGEHYKIHVAAAQARELRDNVNGLLPEHPALRPVALSLVSDAARLRDYAERVAA
jgi:hypothetical protein